MLTIHKAFPTILLLVAVGSTGCNRNHVSASSIEGQIGHDGGSLSVKRHYSYESGF